MTLDHLSTAVPHHLREADRRLAQVQTDREDQLKATPPDTGDPATTTYRGNLEATLRDVRVARERVVSGEYGACVRCDGPIAEERLDFRPWALTCAPCANKE
jgi:DnaK suppressor protein